MFSYTVYGLVIRSVLPLSELIAGEGTADVFIRLGKVDCSRSKAVAEGHCFRAFADETYLFWKEVGTFLVRDGREIVVDPAPGVEEQVLRLFILGPALAVLLHQRGLLILHASAIAVDGGAVAFLGGSGWGKSTMAAALYARGHGLVADDVTVVDLDGNDPKVFPGFPQLKLWPDTAVSLGRKPETLPRLHSQIEKRACRVMNSGPPVSMPLRRIYVLDEGTDHAIEPIGGQDALVELVRHSYAARLIQQVNASLHFLQCANLANKVPVRRLKRLRSLSALPELAQIVEEDLAQPVC